VSNLIRSCCAGMKYLPCKRRALSNFIVIPTPINVGIYYVQRPNRKLMLCMKICMTPRDVYKKDWGQHLLTYVGPKGILMPITCRLHRNKVLSICTQPMHVVRILLMGIQAIFIGLQYVIVAFRGYDSGCGWQLIQLLGLGIIAGNKEVMLKNNKNA